jgi:hypothetical protein
MSLQQQVSSGHRRKYHNGVVPPVEDPSLVHPTAQN